MRRSLEDSSRLGSPALRVITTCVTVFASVAALLVTESHASDRAQDIAVQELLVDARRSFEDGDHAKAIGLCNQILLLQPTHAAALSLRKSSIDAAEEVRDEAESRVAAGLRRQRYAELMQESHPFWLRFEYRYRPVYPYLYDDLRIDERTGLSEFHLVAMRSWTVGTFVRVSLGIGGFLTTGPEQRVGRGFYGRLTLGLPVAPFTERAGMELHVSAEWGVRYVPGNIEGFDLDAVHWARNGDFIFGIRWKLWRFALMTGGGVSVYGHGMACFALEGGVF